MRDKNNQPLGIGDERLVEFLQRRGVEVLVEIGAAVVGERIQTVVDHDEHAVPPEDAAPVARILLADIDTRDAALAGDRARREIAHVKESLKDRVVLRGHPRRAVSHIFHSYGGTHNRSVSGVSWGRRTMSVVATTSVVLSDKRIVLSNRMAKFITVADVGP